MFCDGQIGSTPTGHCRAGFYCTEGSRSPVQNEVPKGYFSLEGSFRPQPCLPGTFQPLPGQSSCSPCPPGNFCNSSSLSDVSTCPQGHYCPLGSIVAMPCPVATFSNVVGNVAIESCELCTLGMFCSRPGLSHPEGFCDSGYYCTWGSNTPFGEICPAGYFCYKGMKEPCPSGTWNSHRESSNSSWCLPCPPGLYCDSPGLVEPAGICHKGYFCILGSTSPRPQDEVTGNICPANHFCPAGSTEPTPCPEGTYSNSTGQSVCKTCPTGHTCVDGDIVQCPTGYYCPEEIDASPVPCPPGTFNPMPGVTKAEGCLPCLPGMFCRDWASSAVSGPCQAGFFCTAGSLVSNPSGSSNESFGGPCPFGHFCPPGTSLPIPCPYGTFLDRLNLSDESQCTPCSPGYYCDSVG
ncbi:hypothetical protein AB205_0165670, partial [Aquarana catesbeiana]